MWRFVLRENIPRYKALLEQAESDVERERFRQMLDRAETELRELEEASTPEIARLDAQLKYFSEHAVDEALKLHRAQFSTLQIYGEQREHLIILAQRNFRAPFLHHLSQMRPGDGSACGRCLAENAPAAIEDVNTDPAFEPHREAAHEAGFDAVQASPVRDGSGGLIAVLSTYFNAARRFSEDELYRMTYFADSIGGKLEKYLSIRPKSDIDPHPVTFRRILS